MSPWRTVGFGGFVLAYAVLSHWLITVAPHQPWLLAAPLIPLLVFSSIMAWRRHNRGLALFLAIVLAVCLGLAMAGQAGDVGRLYLLQHVGIHLVLAVTFGLSLRPGAVPLITAMARLVHEVVPPAMAGYTRAITAVWATYFALIVTGSLVLYGWGTWYWWSMFANVFSPLSVGVLFGLEYAVRYRLHPEFERVTIWRVVHAYQRLGKDRQETKL